MNFDIRWLDIPFTDIEAEKHPQKFFVDKQPYCVYRVLQVRFVNGDWCDVPIVNYENTKQ